MGLAISQVALVRNVEFGRDEIHSRLPCLHVGRARRAPAKVTFITPAQLPDLVSRDQSIDTDGIHPCNLPVGANET